MAYATEFSQWCSMASGVSLSEAAFDEEPQTISTELIGQCVDCSKLFYLNSSGQQSRCDPCDPAVFTPNDFDAGMDAILTSSGTDIGWAEAGGGVVDVDQRAYTRQGSRAD